ncbi:MAG: metal-dependent transcriptional regulator [Endomicrobiia bacterium]|nr:metal-dependent transcriptional regulator [Endomicrobiaceae bacterium]MDD3053355.1 metal-dependent transcriptional regulator [Endomicrobiaceae bacterium]MDD3922279.1 metal-dependent transcriptional regulator [Endomicrobiaceae bacterium]
MIEKLSESLENYLETIAFLKRENKVARVKDISKMLNVKNSSVNIALNVLMDKGFVLHEKYGYVDLTPKGQTIADDIQKKEDLLFLFLHDILGVEKEIALKDACKMEHTISDESLAKLIYFVGLLDKEPVLKRNIQKKTK